MLASVASAGSGLRPDESIFDGPPADYAEVLSAPAKGNDEILRALSVEDRSATARVGALVRVPVFFAAGECRTIAELAIMPADSDRAATPIIVQADDVRRASDGGISRAHLWFAVDLPAGATRKYHLVRRSAPAPNLSPAVPVDATGRGLHITTETGAVQFAPGGALVALDHGGVHWRFADEGAAPRVQVEGATETGSRKTPAVLDHASGQREVNWASGPLFAKVRVRIEAAPGVLLEQDYRIPRHGGHVTIASTIFPGPDGEGRVSENRLLIGRLEALEPAPHIVEVPAGARFGLRGQHAYAVTALARGSDAALLAIPLVIGGANGRWTIGQDGQIALEGQRGLRRGNEGEKQTLHAYWSEVQLLAVASSAVDDLWMHYQAHVQPLVAVVEEPGATAGVLHAALRDVVREMKPIGWRQEAGRALVLGGAERAVKVLQRAPLSKETDEERLLRSAENATAKLSKDGQRKLPEHEKGRAYGLLDPYHVTYTQSAAAALALLAEAPPEVATVNLAMTSAVRRFGGRADKSGYPYIDCFARNLNMQMGPVLFGLTAGAAADRADLVRFYRDLATSPPVLAVFGRGQRPYTGASARKPDQTDYLYQAICDFWLRAAELLANENLSLHPLAYARYTDCIDVMADRYHGVAAKTKEPEEGTVRANFFRGQAHTHRWLGWSCAPYIRLLEDADAPVGTGLTAAIHHTRAQLGRWKNWPDLTYYILADLLVRRDLTRTSRPALPDAPAGMTVRHEAEADRATITWQPVKGAAEYRVYRAAQSGGPFVWVNSPYVENASPPLAKTRFVDAAAPEVAVYHIAAVSADGRVSQWADQP